METGRKDPEGDRLLLLGWNKIEDITCSLVGFLLTKLFLLVHNINISIEIHKISCRNGKDIIISKEKTPTAILASIDMKSSTLNSHKSLLDTFLRIYPAAI